MFAIKEVKDASVVAMVARVNIFSHFSVGVNSLAHLSQFSDAQLHASEVSTYPPLLMSCSFRTRTDANKSFNNNRSHVCIRLF